MIEEPSAASENLPRPPKLVVGLGNPGTEYHATRHNVGFEVVEEVCRRRNVVADRLRCQALVAAGEGYVLASPQTFMNRSGFAVRCLVETHGFEVPDILVIYDELSLPLGKIRLRPGGSPAGHRGMESIIENLRTDRVPRLKVGVAHEDGPPPPAEWIRYVLSRFEEGEAETVGKMIKRAADACELWLDEGVGSAMNRFNS